jgi:hypothetical protein
METLHIANYQTQHWRALRGVYPPSRIARAQTLLRAPLLRRVGAYA